MTNEWWPGESPDSTPNARHLGDSWADWAEASDSLDANSGSGGSGRARPDSGYDPVTVRRGPRRKIVAAITATGLVVAVLGAAVAVSGQAATTPDAATSGSVNVPEPTPPAVPLHPMEVLPAWAVDWNSATRDNADTANVFTGTVVGYGDTQAGSDDIRYVEITYAPPNDPDQRTTDSFELAFIEPFDIEACGAEAPLDDSAARDALEQELPIGSEVLVVQADSRYHGVFVHLMPSGDPSDVRMPQGSVNENLVATGTWQPDVSGGPYKYYQEFPERHWDSDYVRAEGVSETYLELIIAAANQALATTETGQMCAGAHAAYWVEANAGVGAGGGAGAGTGDDEGGGIYYCHPRDGDCDGLLNEWG